MDIVRTIQKLVLAFSLTGLFSGCVSPYLDRDSVDPGLLDIGQQLSYEDCKNYVDYDDYQSCLERVDITYNEVYKKKK